MSETTALETVEHAGTAFSPARLLEEFGVAEYLRELVALADGASAVEDVDPRQQATCVQLGVDLFVAGRVKLAWKACTEPLARARKRCDKQR